MWVSMGVVVWVPPFRWCSPPFPWRVLCRWAGRVAVFSCWACCGPLVFVMFVLPFGFVSSPAAVVAPVVAAPVVGFVPFVPASLVVGAAVVPAASFLPVASGVVSGLGVLGSPGACSGFFVVVGGVRLRCLARGLGGAGSPAFLGLLASLRSARRSGGVVTAVGAPGRGGVVCPGFFCGLVAPVSSLSL